MSEYPSWQYDEMKQIGKDYGDIAEVETYDVRHGKFRNVEKENEGILESLGVKPEHVLIDLGTGTGAFALQAARRCSRVYAVDGICAGKRQIAPLVQAFAVKVGINFRDNRVS